MPISGQGIVELADLLSSTLSFEKLEMYVYASTGDRLERKFVGRGLPLEPTIFALLNALEEPGITPKFLGYVYDRIPGRPEVRQAIVRLCPEALAIPDRVIALSAQVAGKVQSDAPTNAIAPGFQRNVRPFVEKLDVMVWLERLIQIERCVCVVEYGGNAAGTAFLVGPDTVLTNWHVFELVKSANRLGELGCRFDYVRLPGGQLQAGQLVPLHAQGCLDSSLYGASENANASEDLAPSADELDYALLRLATPVGEQLIAGNKRGWISMPATAMPLAENAPLLIVQHPAGGPMKLAMDTQAVIGRNPNGTRIRYTTNTEPGSSGSPCFTMAWDLVALHHYGDPARQNPLFNQGVPIELIRQRIDARGFGSALGADRKETDSGA
jgi:V8-like Glu-specific endopeptidase